jgi:hypothetical protein
VAFYLSSEIVGKNDWHHNENRMQNKGKSTNRQEALETTYYNCFFQMLNLYIEANRNSELLTIHFSNDIKFCTLFACVQIPTMLNVPHIILKLHTITRLVIGNT